MPQIAIEARGELNSAGQTTGSIWCVTPASQIQHYTSTSLSQGSGIPAKVDFVATAGTYSANISFSATLSAGGVNEPWNIPLGSSGAAVYVSNMGQVIRDSWVRTS